MSPEVQKRTVRKARKIKNIAAPRRPIPVQKYKLPTPPLGKAMDVGWQSEEQQALEARMTPLSEIPGGVATDLERVVYKELTSRGYTPPDMDFQSSMLGGRWGWEFGRQIADFVIYSLGLIIEVQGEYWHSPVEQKNRDAERVMRIVSLPRRNVPWKVEYLEEWVIRRWHELEQWMDRNVTFAGMGRESSA